ncbi:hypothetical protein TNCV_4312521 [Trichonephila clavipes]|nr:hypothetical protein TNCV_4312521 [Trichonephila clavipes]
MERRAGSQRPPITSSREDKHVARIALRDRAATESRIGVICKTKNVCTNSSMTFAVAWALSSETITAATLDAVSQIGESSMVSRYISGVLRPVAVPSIQALRNPTFQQDNTWPRVSGIVRTFLDKENVRLLPWTACSPYLTNRKRLVDGCREIGSSLYSSHYG